MATVSAGLFLSVVRICSAVSRPSGVNFTLPGSKDRAVVSRLSTRLVSAAAGSASVLPLVDWMSSDPLPDDLTNRIKAMSAKAAKPSVRATTVREGPLVGDSLSGF